MEKRKGTRCHFCTGCGRCFDGEGVSVVADGGLTEKWQRSFLEEKEREERREKGQENVQKKRPWLAAVDLGTTTIAMVLYDDGGRERDRFVAVNPQTKYGADVISRIQAAGHSGIQAAENFGIRAVGEPGWDVGKVAGTMLPCPSLEMQKSVLEVLERGLTRFGASLPAGELPKRTVSDGELPKRTVSDGELPMQTVPDEKLPMQVVLAGNTTMLYLLQGFPVDELGHAPFFASRLVGRNTVFAGLPAVIFPGLSAFVGADIVAGMFACGMMERRDVTLFVDLGTNGEMALGNEERCIACSTAAGPAFEGGATKGIWGADMIHLTAVLLQEGVLDETGLLADPYFEAGIQIGGVKVTQGHIRQLQLAKGAIAAGIETLADLYGLEGMEQIDRVVLAGGFGYYLQAEDGARIGLLPASLAVRAESGGNAVLAGAFRYGFFPEDASEVLKKITERTKVVNLAEDEGFSQRYLERMDLKPW